MSSIQSWKATALWKHLTRREGEEAASVRATLECWMPDVEQVLKSAGTSPSDFTLHDQEHSFRVAEWMDAIAGEVAAELSEFELALLLLSAYLHDIGMTPAVDRVRRHRDFLLSARDGVLEADEVAHFQRWMDDAGYGVVPPLERDRPLDETVRLANEIVTYYTRHRHNDWSEHWIRVHGQGRRLGSYTGWLEDLVRLCRSHHTGYETLVAKEFHPRRAGSPARVVHLRYLAALLRVADVLDVNPERTPAVVFYHRDISPSSAVYWQKDAELSLQLDGARLTATARPPRAYLHRAVVETIDGIEREVALCRRLDDETHFEKLAGMSGDLPHRWRLEPNVYRDVEPRNGAYEYIDGAFRPSTRRLLELLSGTALYGDPLAAVRELLQNAFDATRELIAYRRLRQHDPTAPGIAEQLGATLHVHLTLDEADGRLWLVCRDEGVGMTKEIIANHLLVSGSPIRSQILELERRCQEMGFPLGRTGQFGIGALSYFMLADLVEITTRRAQEAGDAEAHGWCYTTGGVGSFGELTSRSSDMAGTEVRLRLRSDIASNAQEFGKRLVPYITDTVVRVPCNLHFHTPFHTESPTTLRSTTGDEDHVTLQDSNVAEFPPLQLRHTWAVGWTRTSDAIRDFFVSGFKSDADETRVRTLDNIQPGNPLIGHRVRHWKAIRAYARRTLHVESISGELPGGIGTYRLHLPYFRVPGGTVLALIRPRVRQGRILLRGLADRDLIQTVTFTRWSWKGMAIEVRRETENSIWLGGFEEWKWLGVSAELDFHSGDVGNISVSRGRLELRENAMAGIGWLERKAAEWVERFIHSPPRSMYELLNAELTRVKPLPDTVRAWGLSGGRRSPSLEWRTLEPPFTTYPGDHLLRWKGKPLPIFRPLTGSTIPVSLASQLPPPDRIGVVAGKSWQTPIPIWTTSDLVTAGNALTCSYFPPGWDRICGVNFHDFFVWNKAHQIVQAAAEFFEEPEVEWSSDITEILGSRPRACAWLLFQILDFEVDERQKPSFPRALWTTVFPDVSQRSRAWTDVFIASPSGSVRSYTPDGVRPLSLQEVRQYMPFPDDGEWRVMVVHPRRR